MWEATVAGARQRPPWQLEDGRARLDEHFAYGLDALVAGLGQGRPRPRPASAKAGLGQARRAT
jgi:hypothetical protein